MERLRIYYDNFAARYFTLNRAILYILFYAFMCFLGVSELKLYVRNDDGFYLYFGGFALLLGIFGIFHGAQVIHAVVRRLVAEARSSEHL